MDWVVGIAIALVVLAWLGRDRSSTEQRHSAPPTSTPPPATPPTRPAQPSSSDAPPYVSSMRPEDAYEEGIMDGLVVGYFGHDYWADHHGDQGHHPDADPDDVWADDTGMWDDDLDGFDDDMW